MTPARWATVTLVGLAIGCSSGDEPGSDASVEGIEVVDAWTRPSPATATDAALYVSVDSLGGAADEIVAVGSDRCVTVVPHVTNFDDDGIASMTAVGNALKLPAAGSIVMEPNGLHLMCLGIDAPFAEGDTVAVDLEFAEFGPVVVSVAVENR